MGQANPQSGDGMTLVYDQSGGTLTWPEFIDRHGDVVLNGHPFNITVKMLDSACTLAKEFHFRQCDEEALRAMPAMRDFGGALIKPEVWIRHPDASHQAGPSFIGFRDPSVDRAKLMDLISQGTDALDAAMNRVVISPGEGLYVPGGVVHSLGQGLYFEILAAGDLWVLLEDTFVGKKLSREEQFGPLCKGNDKGIGDFLEFVDFSRSGDELMEQCTGVPTPRGRFRQHIVNTPYFSAEWICTPPGEKFETDNARPHVLVAACGAGTLESAGSRMNLAPGPSSFGIFSNTRTCAAVVVHATTDHYTVTNDSADPQMLLAAYCGDIGSGD